MSENLPTKKEDSLPYAVMDAQDDLQIVEQIKGVPSEVLAYHFKQGNNEVWGVSKAGVDEAKNRLSVERGEALRVIDYQYIDGKDEAYFIVKSGRWAISKDGHEVMLDSSLGSKRQPKKTPSGNDNPFWFEQGLTKAQRNAFNSLIPKNIIQAVIEYAKATAKLKDLGPNDAPVAEATHIPPSSAKFSAWRDAMVQCETAEELKQMWVTNNKQMKLDCGERNFKILTGLKDELKEKMAHGNNENQTERSESGY